VSDGASLYRRLLGRDFDRLPEALRRFHGSAVGGVAAGLVDVHAGAGSWTRALARAMGLPAKGDRVPVTVRVRRVDDREIWERTFGTDHRVHSVQWLDRGRLVERVGTMTFTFDVGADESGMRFRLVHLAALGMRVPRRLVLRVDADVRGSDTDWHVAVVVRTPSARLLTSYQGRVAPSPST